MCHICPGIQCRFALAIQLVNIARPKHLGEFLSQWIWIEASKVMLERLDQITISMLLDNPQTFIQDVRTYIDKRNADKRPFGPAESTYSVGF